jgi:hypothetical protein
VRRGIEKRKISYTVTGSYKCLRKGNWEEPDKSGGIKINAQRGFSNRTVLSGRIETRHRGPSPLLKRILLGNRFSHRLPSHEWQDPECILLEVVLS